MIAKIKKKWILSFIERQSSCSIKVWHGRIKAVYICVRNCAQVCLEITQVLVCDPLPRPPESRLCFFYETWHKSKYITRIDEQILSREGYSVGTDWKSILCDACVYNVRAERAAKLRAFLDEYFVFK